MTGGGVTEKRSWKARQVGEPEPGYFLIRLVRKGPQVPARITHRDGIWQAIINGEPQREGTDPAMAQDVFRIWHGGEAITEAEYLRAMHKARQPSALPPREPIDLTKRAPLF